MVSININKNHYSLKYLIIETTSCVKLQINCKLKWWSLRLQINIIKYHSSHMKEKKMLREKGNIN